MEKKKRIEKIRFVDAVGSDLLFIEMVFEGGSTLQSAFRLDDRRTKRKLITETLNYKLEEMLEYVKENPPPE